jgi:hypothetical protein
MRYSIEVYRLFETVTVEVKAFRDWRLDEAPRVYKATVVPDDDFEWTIGRVLDLVQEIVEA